MRFLCRARSATSPGTLQTEVRGLEHVKPRATRTHFDFIFYPFVFFCTRPPESILSSPTPTPKHTQTRTHTRATRLISRPTLSPLHFLPSSPRRGVAARSSGGGGDRALLSQAGGAAQLQQRQQPEPEDVQLEHPQRAGAQASRHGPSPRTSRTRAHVHTEHVSPALVCVLHPQ